MSINQKNKQSIHHGGDTNWARQMFKYTGNNWLDLSTGINAIAYEVPPATNDAMHLLPQRLALNKLVEVASNYYQVNDLQNLAFAPGSQALIQWLPQLQKCSKTVIIGPTYQEHETCWKRCGHDVMSAHSLDAALALNPDVIVVVNPNNPTGRSYDPDQLRKVARILSARGGLLVVDEAFGDVCPDLSMSPFAGCDGLLILKSFGKFFGLAGIRLGVAVSNVEWATKLNEAIGPWAVSGPTIEIATKAYQDENWIKSTQIRLAKDHHRMNDLLVSAGLKIVGGCNLFTLAESEKAALLLKYLGDHGVMVRHFAANSTWLRFGFPGHEDDWKRLDAILQQYQQL